MRSMMPHDGARARRPFTARGVRAATTLVAIALLAAPAAAQVASRKQSRARPFGLDIVDEVQLAASDERSAEFQANTLPTMEDVIRENLSETSSIADTSGISLDPSKLFLKNQSTVRAYFLGEGAGYHNTLGFYTDGDHKSAELIFPDASSVSDYMSFDGDYGRSRTNSAPLRAGDFVDLGSFEADTQLDFFLIANGANGGTHTYSTESSINPDGIDHVVAFAVPDSPFLIIGFEDLFGGGDRDFNDLVFAVDIGHENVRKLSGAPEPSTLLVLGSFVAIQTAARRRRRGRASASGVSEGEESHP